MPEPMDISAVEAFAKLMTDVIKSSNQDLLTGFKSTFLEEGRKLVKEAGLPREDDDDWDMDDLGDEVTDAVTKGMDRSHQEDARRMKMINDQIAKALGQSRVQRFEFDKRMGEQAISALSKKTALPGAGGEKLQQLAAEKFQSSLGVRGFKLYLQKSEEAVRKLVATGADMGDLMSDENALTKFRVKVLQETVDEQRIKTLSDKKLNALQEALIKDTQIAVLQLEKKNKLGEKYERVQERISGKLQEIPIIGGALSKGFDKAAGNAKVKKGIVGKLASAGLGGAGEAETVGGALVGGAALAGFLAIGAVLALVAKRLLALVGHQINLNSEMVKTLGISSRMAAGLDPVVHQVAVMAQDAFLFGGDFNEALDAAREGAGALVEEFGNLSEVNSENVKQVVGLSQRMGISTGQAAKMVAAWAMNLGISGDKARLLESSLKGAAEKYGLSFNQLMADVAGNAGLLAMYVGRSNDKIVQAAANARRMGTTLESQAKTAEQFESYEGAINNAFTVQFLTGQKMNAQQLYAQANYGDALDIQNKMVDAWQKAKREQGLSIIQQKDLLAAMGLTYEQANAIVYRREQERKIVSDLADLDKTYGTNLADRKSKELEYNKRALRELQADRRAGETITPITPEAVTARAGEIKTAEEQARAGIANVTAALGLGELTSPTEKLQATMVSLLDRALSALVGPIAQGIANIAEIIVDLFGKDKKPEEMNEAELKTYLQSKGMANYDARGNFTQKGIYVEEPTHKNTDEERALKIAEERGYIPHAAIERMKMSQVNPNAVPKGFSREAPKMPLPTSMVMGHTTNEGKIMTDEKAPTWIYVTTNLNADGRNLAKVVTKHLATESKDHN